jgi:RelA/SpoT family protein
MLNIKNTSNISCFNGNFYLPLEDWFLKKNKRTSIQSTFDIEKSLRKLGFQQASDINQLLGHTVALTRGTFYCDFISYDVDGITKSDFGSEILTKDKKIKYHSIDDQYKYKYHEDIELFLPNYLIKQGGVHFIEKEKNHFKYEEEEIVWGYPLKQYMQDEEILAKFPQDYINITKYLETHVMPDLDLLEDTISEMIQSHSIKFDITSRAKNVRGVHSKLEKEKNLKLEEVYDINGLNIMTDNITDCYRVLEIINKEFCPIEFYWDFIAMPKTNKFQCLLVHPVDRDSRIEFQIRTKRMYHTAEVGEAFDYRVNF